MKYYVIIFVVTSCFVTGGLSIKCMSPDDARYVTPAYPIPDFWIGNEWHSGEFFPAPESDGGYSLDSPFLLTTKNKSTAMWWLKNSETGFYRIQTKDQTSILCTLLGAGLQIGWAPAIDETKRSAYCHWNITTHPDDDSMFQLRNAELIDATKDIQTVFLAKTGLYFDYETSVRNDPSNVVDAHRTWLKWVKAEDAQTNMESLRDECTLGENGIPLSIQESLAVGRSVGRRSYKESDFSTEGSLARCNREGWYLYGNKCYRFWTSPTVTQARTKKICGILGGRIVQPTSREEYDYILALIRRVTGSRRPEFWFGATIKDHKKSSTVDDFTTENSSPLPFARWSRSRRQLVNRNCVQFRPRSYWKPTRCTATTGRVFCEKDALTTELPGSETCGKIQVTGIDAKMAQMSGHTGSNRIVGGSSASHGQYPWQVAIRFKTPIRVEGYTGRVYHNCGGALLDNCWVLTAAHCFYDRDERNYRVRLGDWSKKDRDGTEQEFDIEKLIIHEEYTDIPIHTKDIALLRLQRNAEGNCAIYNDVIQPVCLPTKDFEIKNDGEKCQVSGWGVTDTDVGQASAADILQYVTVPTMRDDICAARYNKKNKPAYFRDDVMFCAGYKEGNKDSCSGDSGGPYVCRGKDNGRYAVFGIVSFGIGCARKNYPGVYTRVRKFLPWIYENMAGYEEGRNKR